MKISYNWLKSLLDFDLSPQECEKILSSIGLEVEAMDSVETIPGGLKGVVVAEVLECSSHPDADKLKVTKVLTGNGEQFQVVCGAPNVAVGQKVMLATVGTELRFSDGKELTIKISKIRGVESYGMLCAEDELGIGTSHDGIIVLPSNVEIGTSAKDYYNIKSDTLFEIGLTPNRVDAASHLGVARDLRAYLQSSGKDTKLQLPSVELFDSLPQDKSRIAAKVTVKSHNAAPRYMGLTISGITVKASPDWLQERLLSIGLKPINNIVDITNFILHETGQPLHAFDLATAQNREIVVREAFLGEKMVTLDGIERELNEEDLLICDSAKPMCIGGVFGGKDSGVKEQTTEIFLESAYFNPVSIRKTSKRHALKTDASFRFERGADPNMLPYALKRAAILINQIAGGSIVGEIVDLKTTNFKAAEVELDYNRIRKFIGKEIPNSDLEKILLALEFKFISQSKDGAMVSVPTYKVDVLRECDVVEEILRIYGYNNIELPQSVKASVNTVVKPEAEKIRTLISDLLSNNGFFETMNNSLTKSDYYSLVKSYSEDSCIKIMNPLSSDLNVLRQTLLFNGLEVVSYNINRQKNTLKIYEVGNVYSISDGNEKTLLNSYNEEGRVSIFMTGEWKNNWSGSVSRSGYFLLKGYIELIINRLGGDINSLKWGHAPSDIFKEGITLLMGDKKLVEFGSISAKLLKSFGIKQEVYAAEFYWPQLFNLLKKNRIEYKELPKYPEVKRDLAILLNEDVNYYDIRKSAFKSEKTLLKEVTLFDVYSGDKIPEGKKQYALSFTLQDLEKTLTDSAVEDVMGRIFNGFVKEFDATLR